MNIQFMFKVFEQYLFANGDLHMGICIWGFAHQKFAYGDLHLKNCLKKHILDRLCLHMVFVCIW